MAFTYQGFASLSVNLNRQKYGPLDISNVFTSKDDLKYYLTRGTHTEGVSEYWYKDDINRIVPYPYEGQVLATVLDGVVEIFSLAADPEAGVDKNGVPLKFETHEIGAKIEVDGKTIKLNADGKLELVGLPEDISGKTLVPSLINGVLTWAEPDTSTADGQAQEIEGLKTRTTQLEANVAAEVAAREAAIGVEASEGVEASGLYAAIEAAEARAKAYADENDANTVYDDTALAARVKAIEDDYLKEEDRYDDSDVLAGIAALDEAIGDTESGLVKEVSDNAQAITKEKARAEAAEKALGERIDAIDFVDTDELNEAIKDFATKAYVDGEIDTLEAAIAALNHFKTEIVESIDNVTEVGVLYLIKDETVTGTDKYNEYIVVGGEPVLIGDTTTDLSDYYNKTEVDELVETINTAISGETTARGELASRVDVLETADETFEASLSAITEELGTVSEMLEGKVDSTDFETFKTENTSAVGTAKDEAIAAAKTETEAQVGELRDAVAESYATKDELTEAVEGIENDLTSYANAAEVAAELGKKIETGSIVHSTEELAEGVTVNGTQLNIVVDAYTKAETLAQIEEILDQINDNSESAASVDTKLTNHIKTYEEKVGQIDTKNSEQDAAIAAAQSQADKGVADAKKVSEDLAAANVVIGNNTNEINVVKGTITTVNETLSGKITSLENKDIELAGLISGLDTAVKGNSSTIGGHTASIAALEAKDTELAGQINGVDAKFSSYYDKDTVDSKVQAVANSVAAIDLTPYAIAKDVNDSIATINASIATKADADKVYTKDEADAEFMTQDEVDARINALIAASDPEGDGNVITNIQNLVEYVENNAGEIAALLTTVGNNTTAIGQNTTNISTNTAAIAAINDTIAALIQPKASDEISVVDGVLGIKEMNVNKLVQTEGDVLVLNGGNAEVKVTE